MRIWLAAAFMIMAAAGDARAAPAAADASAPAPDTDAAAREIVVYGRALAQIGIATAGSQGTVGYRDLENRPLLRAGELAEAVPGLIATQHSGTGKANQYFLRGFNLDHGTDFAGFVDGVPINMRTHGHGQGYLDLNFLIPELVERIDYAKGPYQADAGDFSAAGTVKFGTYAALPAPIVQATIGTEGYYRALAAGSGKLGDGTVLAAIEGVASNGPWVLDERFRKINGIVKYTGGGEAPWSLALAGYHARWNSTDQIPLRAVQEGLISRLGNIDPDLGGKTTRLSLTGHADLGGVALTAYAVYYKLRLTSNFTYFLNDPVNGDEFQQRDQRGQFGGSLRRSWDVDIGLPVTLTLGADTRYDHIGKVGLYTSVAGHETGTVRQDRVDEISGDVFVQAKIQLADTLRAIVGARGDLYHYDVRSSIPVNSRKGHDGIATPKLALAWTAARHLELYADYGESFHSNDARGAAISVDPVTRLPADRVPLLVRARGAELGARLEYATVNVSLVGYYLTLGSELVYGGDSGTTEPNDASRRYGTELTAFWHAMPWLSFDLSAAATHARFRHDPGFSHIPNSVSETVAAGATLDLPNGISGAVRLRHFGAAPLIEDDSARSKSTTLVNVGAYYTIGGSGGGDTGGVGGAAGGGGAAGHVRFGLDIYNIFDSRRTDITYFYTSRLQGEPAAGIDDYHFHPVEPREFRGSVRYAF